MSVSKGNRRAARWGMALALGVALAFPLGAPQLYSTFYLDLVIKIFIFGVLLVGYDLLAGYAGMVSFGHAMFFGVGAYTEGLLLLHTTLPWPFAFGAGVVLAAVVAYLIGYLSIQTKGIYFILLTQAFGQFFYLVAYHWNGLTGGADGLHGIPKVSLGPFALDSSFNYYYFALTIFTLAWMGCRRVVRSPFGRALVAIRQNEERARFLGYNTRRYQRQAFLISGILGGVAGCMFVTFQNYVVPDFLHWSRSGDFILMTWLGGVGTLIGPVLGAGVVLYFGDLLSSWTQNWMIFMGALYVLFVLFSPRGLMGMINSLRWQRRDPNADKTG